MTFDNLDTEGMDFDVEESTPPEESSNRTFIIVAGILGGITLLALICIAVYAFVFLPRQRADREREIAERNAQNTQIALAITQTSAAAAFTDTPTVTPVPNTPTPTRTPVIAIPTNTTVASVDPRTATVSALLTQAAQVTQTVMPTSTALPDTGFADDVGIPGLLGMAVLLIAIIILARRLRVATPG
ncbi:MAG: LPXTG cell wall anchor domain-containing protein [Anaerolineales bacterium]|nr:MAG: LPXTG cell wall anchor domain-containing protein [Anaerolineales bacterium]